MISCSDHIEWPPPRLQLVFLQSQTADGEVVRIYPTLQLVNEYNDTILNRLNNEIVKYEPKEPNNYEQKPSEKKSSVS